MTREDKKLQRQKEGRRKMNEIIDNAESGDFLFQTTDDNLSWREDVRFEPAKYVGSFDERSRILMFKAYKI